MKIEKRKYNIKYLYHYTLKENIEEFNEKYYYDYNTNKLSYMLTTYVETPNQTTTGEFVEVTIE